MRVLRQDPFECAMSFLCSQNNHVKRIAQLVEALARNYGSQICEVDGIVYFSFPSLTELKLATEAHLRALKFGYRARYVV